MATTWSVVKFPEENSVEVVPSIWLTDTFCCWPRGYTESQLKEALAKSIPPEPSWDKYPYVNLRHNVFDSYAKAISKVNKAKYLSDLESAPEEPVRQKKRRIIKRVISSSFEEDLLTDEEVTIPKPPKIRKNCVRKMESLKSSDKETLTSLPRHEQQNMEQTISNETMNTDQGPRSQERYSLVTRKATIEEGASESPPVDKFSFDNTTSAFTAYLKKIIANQNILKGMISDISRKIDDMENKLKSPVEVQDFDNSIFTRLVLPIDGDNDLEALESYLQGEDEMKQAIKELSSFGGKNIYDFIYRCTEKLITNRFGAQFSLLGRKKKKTFKELKLYELLLKSGMKTFKEITEKDVECNISKWLRRCNERAKTAEGNK